MAELINDRYAQSLFEAALDLKKIDTFYKELNEIKEIFLLEDKLIEILKHPRIAKDEKKSLIKKVFERNISIELINFFYVIIDKRREKYLYGIIGEFNKKYDEYMNIADVVAVTAVPMKDKDKERLASKLEKRLNKKIKLNNEIDESIIGGVMLKIGNKFMDSTLANQLKSMETIIKDVSL